FDAVDEIIDDPVGVDGGGRGDLSSDAGALLAGAGPEHDDPLALAHDAGRRELDGSPVDHLGLELVVARAHLCDTVGESPHQGATQAGVVACAQATRPGATGARALARVAAPRLQAASSATHGVHRPRIESVSSRPTPARMLVH